MTPYAQPLAARRGAWALVVVFGVAIATSVAFAALRVQVQEGETVESMAERYYGDKAKAAVLRAANKLEGSAQPTAGTFFKIPGPTIHTVAAGENLGKIAERFLSGEGGEQLLAEANNLRDGKVRPGQAITVFSEVEVKTGGRSAEDLATIYLGDANLGARIRRYNGLKDGGKLPAKVAIPLVGLEPRSGGGGGAVVAPATPAPAETPPAPPPVAAAPVPAPAPTPAAPVAKPTPAPAPVAQAPKATPPVATKQPPRAPAAPVPAQLAGGADLPVTGKRATIAGFMHRTHTPFTIGGLPIGCIGCHKRIDPNGVEHMAPEQTDCLVCHRVSDELPKVMRKGAPSRLPLIMNHKAHLDDERRASLPLLKDADCKTCHVLDPERPIGMGTGGHSSCVQCHAKDKALPALAGDPNALQCLGCHGSVEEIDAQRESTRYLRAHLVRPYGRAGDTFFDHGTHATFSRGGKPAEGQPEIACRTCHADVPETTKSAEISHVKMQGCQECHRQANWTGLPAPQDCQGCHLHLREGLPPDNETVLGKPLDHTAFFRRNHASAARERPQICASCHAGVDPTDGARCDTCHANMRPRDHTAGWRDRVHGRTAQIDPARCTTCHRAERCESCHREVPKSHFPLEVWTDKGLHGSRGRLELGACLTCHRFETTCQRCHTSKVQ
jgi:LysM repeat protein